MLRWGIIGVGRAGKARARALAADPRATVVAGWRGDVRQAGLPPARSLAHLIDGVDAVAICSPDVTHPQLVRACLRERRHVVVEFPLAGTTSVARELLDGAREVERVLHVEHIELLSGSARFLREAARGRRLTGGSLTFVGARRRGIYGVAHANLARLHRVVDAVGLPDAVRVAERGPRFLRGALRFGDAELSLDLSQSDDVPRQTLLALTFADGTLEQRDRAVFQDGREVALPELAPLFEQDQLHATARILDGAAPYVSDERLLEVVALADALVRASPGGDWEPYVPPSPAA